ncbi:MAG: type II toxin-antitoxin system VapC family toxin, partial [Rhodospirillaceae bacterium]|nr:type II toxin-antitoxin system VapC family toxin [Rhodospirillaceae bacterium]
MVSAASAWEIATKFRIGKLPGCEAVATDVAGHTRRQGFEDSAIGVADAERAGRLPGPHCDPFDRMLAAQALAHDGNLEQDRQALLEAAGLAAGEAATALVVFVDELQYVQEDELASLIIALHRIAQRKLPVVLVGADYRSCAPAWAAPNPTPSDC